MLTNKSASRALSFMTATSSLSLFFPPCRAKKGSRVLYCKAPITQPVDPAVHLYYNFRENDMEHF